MNRSSQFKPSIPQVPATDGNAELTPRARLWSRLAFASLLLWAFLAMCFPLYDTDFWWHLKTGEWILAGNGIPGYDFYTFKDYEGRWIDLHWGFQVLIALLYRLGGIPLVTLTKAAIITTAIGIAWQAGGKAMPCWMKAGVWLLPIICIFGRGIERPEMLSQLFLALWLGISRWTDQRPSLIWWLIPIQLCWVNCHSLFILGLVVGFCYAVEAVVLDLADPRRWLSQREGGPDFRTLCIAAGLVILVCFVNPYFEEGAAFPWTVYQKFSSEQDFYRQNIYEFHSPLQFIQRHGFGNIFLLAELGTWLIAASSFVWLLILKSRFSIFRVMLFAGFSHLAWLASRNTNIFALVAGFVACENFVEAHRAHGHVEVPWIMRNLVRPLQFVTACGLLLSLLVVTGVWHRIGEKDKPFGLGESPNWFIHDAARFAAQPGFPEIALVSNIGQAEVYVYHNAPRCRVFMDARLEVCSRKTFEEFNAILRAISVGDPRWETAFRDSGLPVVIFDSRYSRPGIEGLLQSPNWTLVFADRAGAVFLPKEQAEKLKLKAADYTPLLYPDGPPAGAKSTSVPAG